MFSPNAYARIFEDMDVLKFAMNFRKLGSVDVRIIEYLDSLEEVGKINEKVFKGSYADLAKAIGYDDISNLRKAIIRLEDNVIIRVERNGQKRNKVIHLNSYWMLRVKECME